MDFLDEHVGTQYEDYKGLVSIDCHGGGLGQDIFGMCRDFGIDTKLKFPMASVEVQAPAFRDIAKSCV